MKNQPAPDSPFVAQSDDMWWGRIARAAIAEGRDKPASWGFDYDDGADGCMPSGWYVQGLDPLGMPIDWPIRHEYGPFASESEARDYTAEFERRNYSPQEAS